jgi:hypothetical protein
MRAYFAFLMLALCHAMSSPVITLILFSSYLFLQQIYNCNIRNSGERQFPSTGTEACFVPCTSNVGKYPYEASGFLFINSQFICNLYQYIQQMVGRMKDVL